MSEYREALEAVRDALDLPHAATVGGDEVRSQIIGDRLTHVTLFLEHALADPPSPGGIAWSIAYFRERIAEHPAAGYVTEDQAREALSRGATWTEAVARVSAEEAGQ